MKAVTDSSVATALSRYVWVGALYEKVREDTRVESIAVVIATGVYSSNKEAACQKYLTSVVRKRGLDCA